MSFRSSVPSSDRRPWQLPLALLLVMATILVIGLLAYRNQADTLRLDALQTLEAVAELKADMLTRWLAERRATVRGASLNPATAAALARWLQRKDALDEERLAGFLHNFRQTHDYAAVELLDAQGRRLIGEGDGRPPGAQLQAAIREAVASGEPVMLDLYRDAETQAVHLGQLAPIFLREEGGRQLLGILFVALRAEAYLYPLLQHWPLPSQSGELLLVRREGEDIVYLNALRHRPDAAFQLRLPLSTPDLPAAMAVRAGTPVTVAGVDYRGLRALVSARPVPGTKWFLGAKMDEAEALEALHRLALMTAGLVVLAQIATTLLVVVLWRRRQPALLPESITAESRPKPRLRAAAAGAALTLALGALVCILVETALAAEARRAAREVAAQAAAQLERHLGLELSATRSLAAMVKAGGGRIPNFEGVARDLLPIHRGVSALELAPGGVIRQVVPLEGNEEALGHDILADPARSKEARLAMETGQLTLAGPVELRQGGIALIGRQPVYLDGPQGDKQFWGFTIALIRMSDLLGAVWLDRLEQLGYSFQLGRRHPDTGQAQVFAGSTEPLARQPEQVVIEVPNGRWTLDITPQDGWHSATRMGIEAGVVALLAFLAGFIVERLARSGHAVEASEKKYRLLVTTLREGIWQIDSDHRTTYANATMAQLLGYVPDEMVGLPLEHFIFPEDMAEHRARMEGRHQGQRGLYELRARRKDGSACWCLISSTPLQDGEGRFVGSIAMVTDFNARKTAETELETYRAHLEDLVASRTAEARASEAKFRAIVEQSLAGIYILQGGYIRYANQQLATFFGYDSPAELVDRVPVADLLAPEDRHRVTENIRRRTVGSVPEMHYSFGGLRRDGERIEVEVYGRAFEFNGEPAVIGIMLDITERERAEEKLRQQAAVFSSAQEGIVITGMDGAVLAINPAFTTITEYGEEDILGKNMRVIQSGRHDRHFYQNLWHSVLSTGTWQGEIWNRRKGGEVCPEWLTISTVRSATGEPVSYVGVLTDISRMNHAESELERMAQHDALTGLPNRMLLASRLEHTIERARRSKGQGAVLFIDLDRFKHVNDTLGHGAGDELLQAVARRMRDRLRNVDTLSRLGGDEFVVVLDAITAAEGVTTVAEDLLAELREPFVLSNGAAVNIGGSIGIARFPADGEDPQELIERADKALYQAKAAGRSTFRFFSV